ncbi:hypothetical protein F5883DRAFT_417533 [Diaporthe sp. PMI_573]|nr:hypothetical protein F5883DRAFT_417533 [Diaporthaceae sp. PMI_573]
MASSLESPTFPWKRDPWVTTPRPDNIDKSTAVDTLDERHQAVFKRAITNLLATELAEMTYAQLIDGLPLWEVALDQYRHTHTGEEPVSNHRELCPGVVDQTTAPLQSFDPLVLEIRSDALKRYQSAPVGLKASKIPLIELIAVALHVLAVQVFLEVDGGFHKHETWPSDDYYDENPIMRRKKPTPFILWLTFDTPEQYSDGVADMAAYWAEDRILGGVVLFGREKSGKEVCCFLPLLLAGLY